MVPDSAQKIQISLTLTYPNTIKAIHNHSEQTDLWAPVTGMVQVFLYDLRRNSKTFGLINTIIQLLYMTDRHYNRADELRRPNNDPNVAYDWEAQHK